MIVEQRTVFARHLLNGHWSRESLVRDFLTFFCFLVAFGKQVSPNLSQSRALDSLTRQGIFRDALIRRKPARDALDSFTNYALNVLLSLFACRYDQRDQLPVLLQHADLADCFFARVSFLHVIRLNFLAALGDDQCRDAAKKVQIAFIIHETQVASAKPPVSSERLPRLFFEIAIAGENAWATCEYFALAFQAAHALFFFGRPNAQLNASDRFADAVERGLAGEIERQ